MTTEPVSIRPSGSTRRTRVAPRGPPVGWPRRRAPPSARRLRSRGPHGRPSAADSWRSCPPALAERRSEGRYYPWWQRGRAAVLFGRDAPSVEGLIPAVEPGRWWLHSVAEHLAPEPRKGGGIGAIERDLDLSKPHGAEATERGTDNAWLEATSVWVSVRLCRLPIRNRRECGASFGSAVSVASSVVHYCAVGVGAFGASARSRWVTLSMNQCR